MSATIQHRQVKSVAPANRFIPALFFTFLGFASGASAVDIGDIRYSLNIDTKTATAEGLVTRPATDFTLTIPGTVTDNSVTYSVTALGDFAFSGGECRTDSNTGCITSLALPEGLRIIPKYAFSQNSLAKITIPESVTTIGLYAFYNNDITELVIPDNVISISEEAFRANPLQTLIIGKGATTIERHAFYDNKLSSVYFRGNYSSSIQNNIFDINDGDDPIETVFACDSATGWDDVFFIDGRRDSKISVTLRSCAPVAPTITSAAPTDSRIVLVVAANRNGFGTDVTRFRASCTDGTNTFASSSSTSPVTVFGLTNGVSYTCTVTATNSDGTSLASVATDSIVAGEQEIANGLPIWLLYEATK